MSEQLKKEVREEIKRKKDRYRGKEWIAIHRNTANHILELLEKE